MGREKINPLYHVGFVNGIRASDFNSVEVINVLPMHEPILIALTNLAYLFYLKREK